MRPNFSLRQRIIAAYMLLALAVSGCFTLVAVVTVETLEGRLINGRLTQMADYIIANADEREDFRRSVGMRLYIDDEIPPRWRHLKPGAHERGYQGGHYHLLVKVVDGRRFLLADDESRFESLEHTIFAILGATVVGSLLLAFVLGRLTASRIIAPVTALADAVAHPQIPMPLIDVQDELGILARAFAARAREQEAFLMREQLFTGDVSHELRTPLTIILGAAELLQMQLQDQTEPLRVVERIRRATADATERINALLLLSRAPESLDAPRIALHDLLRAEVERCQSLLKGKPVDIELNLHHEVWVQARPELAAMAIGNLLRNACQYTEAGRVTVTLHPDRVEIIDSGPGLPAPVREQLFKRFVHESVASTARIGLGLSIVKRIAAHLGWQVSLQSPPEGGTCATLLFPL